MIFCPIGLHHFDSYEFFNYYVFRFDCIFTITTVGITSWYLQLVVVVHIISTMCIFFDSVVTAASCRSTYKSKFSLCTCTRVHCCTYRTTVVTLCWHRFLQLVLVARVTLKVEKLLGESHHLRNLNQNKISCPVEDCKQLLLVLVITCTTSCV